jgi:hypothetical protein
VTAPDGGRQARLVLARGEGPFVVDLYDMGAIDGAVDALVLVVAAVTPQKK